MPARSTSKSQTSAKKRVVTAPAKAPVANKRMARTAKPCQRKAAAKKAKPTARKAAPPRPKAVAKKTAVPTRGKRASKAAAPPGTISVGGTQYVLGEYGALMTVDEYERMMAKKTSG